MHATRDKTGMALVEAARALAPQVQACADQIEAGRQLPRPLVDALAAAGLFKMFVPRELGGGEAHPAAALQVIEEVARADGSAAWCVAIPTITGLAAGTLREDVAREIFGRDAHAYAAGTGAGAGGRASAVEGGFRLTGRWSFTSGCRHATWLIGTGAVYDGETPRLSPDGTPEKYWLFFPVADAEIIDTWHVSGLCGSGSHDIAVADIFVPDERTVRFGTVMRPRHPGPLYALGAAVAPTGADAVASDGPWDGLIPAGFASVSLGIARGSLDAFAALAGSKRQLGGRALLRDNAAVQAQFGQAEATLRAARAFLYETVREAWETICRTGGITPEQRTLLRLAGTHAAAHAAEVVETVWKAAGTSSIFVGSALERRFRDAHVITQNVAVSPIHHGAAGRHFLGLDSV